MYSLNELKKQNQEINDLIEVISTLIKDKKLMRNPFVCDLVTRFNEKVWMHLVFEDNSIYAELAKHHNPEISEIASDFHNGAREIRKDFAAYMKHWCKVSGSDHHEQAFCEETEQMLVKIKARIDYETEQMFPLVETQYAA